MIKQENTIQIEIIIIRVLRIHNILVATIDVALAFQKGILDVHQLNFISNNTQAIYHNIEYCSTKKRFFFTRQV